MYILNIAQEINVPATRVWETLVAGTYLNFIPT